jgi:hypothetical protein
MNRKIFKAIAFGSVFSLASCGDSPKDVMNKFDADKMQYDIDTHTGLCFSIASVTVTDSQQHTQAQLSHAHVPCTREVLEEIRKTRPGKLDRLEVSAYK